MKKVAIIGGAFRFPGTTTSTYWDDLLHGRNLVTTVDPERWSHEAFLHPDRKHPGKSYTFAAGSVGDVSGFDAAFFGISPREAAQIDPQQRLLLELSWEAIENAGMPPAKLAGTDCAVFVGFASADYAYSVAGDLGVVESGFATGNTGSVAANRLSYFFDLKGPSMAVDTACSSSLVAFHQACRSIVSGESTHALAGGVSLHLHPYGFIIFSKASMLSPDGRCKVFDADGNGYVRSEGAAMVLLKDYDRAVADGDRILAVVPYTAVNTDGHKRGLTVPNCKSQADLLEKTYRTLGLDPNDIDYIEAHGTGTAVGDPIETRALAQAVASRRRKDNPLPIGSVKSNMGHLETASGMAGLFKAVYAIRHRVVPATIGIETLNPAIPFEEWNLTVVQENLPLKQRGLITIGVNSFGFGGVNAHVVLQSPDETPSPQRAEPSLPEPYGVPLLVSAANTAALQATARQWHELLTNGSVSAYDLAAHSLLRRHWHAQRAVAYGRSTADFLQALSAIAEGESLPGLATGKASGSGSGPVFVYSGNGSQWHGMGRALMEDPVFAAAIQAVDIHFQPLAGVSVKSFLVSEAPDVFSATEFAQPALFAVQVGITEMLRAAGVKPLAVVGHSVGEIAAAWACGALRLADAVRVIYYRSFWQGKTRGQGVMTAAGISAEGMQQLLLELPELQGCVWVAGANSSRGCTVAGTYEGLAQLEEELSAEEISFQRLDLDYAFHSPLMDSVKDGVLESLSKLQPQAESIPFYSVVHGKEVPGTSLDAQYWWLNIRQPVEFEAAVSALVKDGQRIFVEIGPHAILRSYVADALKQGDAQGTVLPTGRRGVESTAQILATAGQVLLAGGSVDFQALFQEPPKFVEIPAYPWQRERFWYQNTPQHTYTLHNPRVHPLLGFAVAQHDHSWEATIDTRLLPSLADHKVGDSIVFPGSGFVEIALAASQQWQPGPTARVQDLEILAPLLLDAGVSRQIRVTLEPSDGRMLVQARTIGSDEPWRLHARARVLPEPGKSLPPGTVPDVPEREPDFNGELHDTLTRAVGLNYGSAYCAVSHGWLDGDTIVAELAVPEAISEEVGHYYLHPALLDSTFQLIIQRLKDAAQHTPGVIFVPAQVGETTWFAAEDTVPHRVFAKLRARNPHSVTADFALYNREGRLVAKVSQARFTALFMKKTRGQALQYLKYQWVPAPKSIRLNIPPELEFGEWVKNVQKCASTLAEAGAVQQLAYETDPLLDALLARYTAEFLNEQCEGNDEAINSLLPLLTAPGAPAAALFGTLLQLAEQNELLTRGEDGWTLNAEALHEVPAADIWLTLLRDCGEAFPLVHAAGRLGLRLPRLARLQPADAAASAVNAASLAATTEEGGLDTPWPDLRETDLAAEIEWSLPDLFPAALGTPTRNTLCGLVKARMETALAHLPAGQKLLVGEFSESEPWFDKAVAAGHHPDLLAYSFDGDTEVAAQDGVSQLHVAIVVLNAADPARNERRLRTAAARLLPGGSLIAIGLTASGWLQALLQAREISGTTQSADILVEQLSSRDYAETLHAYLGTQVETINLWPTAAGPFVLLAPAGKQAQAGSEQEVEATHTLPCLLLHDADPGPVASALIAQLRAAYPALETCVDTEPTGVAAMLAQFVTQAGGSQAHILDFRGLPGHFDLSAPADVLDHQVTRCDAIGSTARLLQQTGFQGDYWVAAAMPAHHDGAVPGFMRTLMNEADGFTPRLLYLDTTAIDAAALAEALVLELREPDAEQEVQLDAAGNRWVPRLRTLPAPAAGGTCSTIRSADAGNVVELEPQIRLGFDIPGQLRNLRWETLKRQELQEGEIEVEVKATGLNFRDVMYTLGLLSDEAVENGFAGASIGLEFSGVVSRVGDGVSQFRPGDAVVGFGPHSFTNFAVTREGALAALPPQFSFEAAATIPSTFFTAYYALVHQARLQPGESVLIHGAAGGVGLAAIQIAHWIGAEVFATAGSAPKRDLLRLLGIRHVYDSRSLGFADAILDTTAGQGVDVVLNSLAGEAINRNLQALKPFGRFIELGKRDFYENTRIGLRPFRNNISYFGIDADQLMKVRPDLTAQLFQKVMELFAEGVLFPLPYETHDAADVVDAFRQMQQARHIGKILVTYSQGMPVPNAHRSSPSANNRSPAMVVSEQASYIVTGGLSGFGLKTAQWLADKGARHLVLLGRRGATTDESRQAVAELRAQGVNVLAPACDITDLKALSDVIQVQMQNMPPIKGVVHAATVIDDGLILNLNADRIRAVLAPKLLGALHLHLLLQEQALDFFVVYSSGTTLFGNPGQANYVAANMWLEAFCEMRRAQGLAATSVLWGAIEDAGFLARNTATLEALQKRMGGLALHSQQALAALECLIANNRSGEGVLDYEWKAMRRFLPSAGSPKFSEIAASAPDTRESGAQSEDIQALLAERTDDELLPIFVDQLRAEVAEILRIPADKLDPETSLYDVGLDSLMGVELMLAIESRFGKSLPTMSLADNHTLTKLAALLLKHLRSAEQGGQVVEEAPGSTLEAQARQLAQQHDATFSAEETEIILNELRNNPQDSTQ